MVSHRNIWPRKISGTSDEEKIHLICGKLLGMKMSPKQFITGFLTKKNSLLRYRRRTWTTKYGWTPTIKLVQVIADDFRKTREGSARWAWFIQAEGNQHRRETTLEDLSKAHALLHVNSLKKVPSMSETGD
ncbi:hypothetical protein PSTG_19877 [Puccinia striiformis f. sp. tritici PST-78]|uniref:Uncharacterized protein n=1 Tax=Puccinia striiformis f. sp. tritici PST-78 TaxID=1165861 RepID=A0A0L0UJ58_9BASI|nr:hypothetical protein PSTG_19877 [Puccinia striiformis f. sp. tritici PST-78]